MASNLPPETPQDASAAANDASAYIAPRPLTAEESAGFEAIFAGFGKMFADELRERHDKPETVLETATGALVGAATSVAVQEGTKAASAVIGQGAAQAAGAVASNVVDAGVGGLAVGIGTTLMRRVMLAARSRKEKDADARREAVRVLKSRTTLEKVSDARSKNQALRDTIKKLEFEKLQKQRHAQVAKHDVVSTGDKHETAKTRKAKRRAAFTARMKTLLRSGRIAAAGALHIAGNIVKSKGYMVTGAAAGTAAGAAAPGMLAAAGAGGWLTASMLGITGAAVATGVGMVVGVVGAAVVVDTAVKAVTGGDGFLSPMFDYAVMAMLSENKAEHGRAIKKMQRRYGVIGRRVMRIVMGPSIKEQSPMAARRASPDAEVADEVVALPPQSSRRRVGARFAGLSQATPATVKGKAKPRRTLAFGGGAPA